MCYNLKIITQAHYHWLFQCNRFIACAATSVQTVLLGLVYIRMAYVTAVFQMNCEKGPLDEDILLLYLFYRYI